MKYILSFIALITLAFPISVKAEDYNKTYELQATYNTQQQAKYDELQWSSQLVEYAKTLQGKNTGQCVLTLRNYFGIPRSEVQGLAKNTKINSTTGKVGAIVVFKRMSWAGHVAIQITPVDANGNFTYFAGNENKGRAVIKTINISDKRISGYRII